MVSVSPDKVFLFRASQEILLSKGQGLAPAALLDRTLFHTPAPVKHQLSAFFSVSQVKMMDKVLCIGKWIWAQFKYFYLSICQQSCQTMK